jgi:bifunctional non-homologous end joining protein LigD
LHYDLRLELGGVFHSWAVTRGPSLDPAEKRLAVEVEEHPLEYGDFEGTIPKGEYGGGTVMIWDRGYWAPEGNTNPVKALKNGELKFVLAGSKLAGSWVLVRLKPREGEKRTNWLLIKHRDRWATPGRDTILDKARSVASGRAMSTIAKGEGRAPAPFMIEGMPFGAAAKWHSGSSVSLSGPSRSVVLPRLTNPDRVLWPEAGLTKHDLAEYLCEVAPWMVDHFVGRPCSFVRAPDGIDKETFFQRHPMRGQPASVSSVTIDDEREPYMSLDEAQAIVDVAQISVVEFHLWNCAPSDPDVPGRLVFDLDPAPDIEFGGVIDAARHLRDRLQDLGLVAFCMTTGGKGLHVVAPLEPDKEMNWEQAKLFAQTVSAQMSEDNPNRFVINMSKRVRKGRIFLDYLRNDFAATAVAPLSPRARPEAFVAMPLTWGQVRKGLDPSRFTLETAAKLLEKSKAWHDYAKSTRSLKPAIARLLDVGR